MWAHSIQALAVPRPAHNTEKHPSTVDVIEAQTAWFKSHGGECSSVRIGTSEYGRAVFAARPIIAGEQMIGIPNHLMLTAEKLPEGVSNLLKTQYDWSQLSLLLLAEQHKGQASAWAPYIACLPALDEMHSTIFWEKEELAHLQCSHVFRGTMERREMLLEEFAEVKKVIIACPDIFGDKVSFDEFMHAYATVVSRAWNGGSSSDVALRPFVDFCNHNPDFHTAVSYDIDKDATIVIADRDYAAGDQVFISYGKRSNAILAVDYGFVLPRNPHDQAEIWMTIPCTDPLRERKLELLAAYNMPTLQNADGSETGELPVWLEEVTELADWEDQIVLPQARAFARVICSDSVEDLQEMIEESDTSKMPLALLPRKDKSKETQAMCFLSKMIEENIERHENTLLRLQEQSMQPVRREMAEALLAGELRVLQNASAWLKGCIPEQVVHELAENC